MKIIGNTYTKFILVSLLLIVVSFFCIYSIAPSLKESFVIQAASITWTGAAGNHLWSDSGNWSTNSVPSTNGTDDIILSSTYKVDLTIDTTINVNSITVQSGYDKTITQSSSATLTNLVMNAGTFNGSATMSIHGNLDIESGATFTTNQQITFNDTNSSPNVASTVTCLGTVTDTSTVSLVKGSPDQSVRYQNPASITFNSGCSFTIAADSFGQSYANITNQGTLAVNVPVNPIYGAWRLYGSYTHKNGASISISAVTSGTDFMSINQDFTVENSATFSNITKVQLGRDLTLGTNTTLTSNIKFVIVPANLPSLPNTSITCSSTTNFNGGTVYINKSHYTTTINSGCTIPLGVNPDNSSSLQYGNVVNNGKIIRNDTSFYNLKIEQNYTQGATGILQGYDAGSVPTGFREVDVGGGFSLDTSTSFDSNIDLHSIDTGWGGGTFSCGFKTIQSFTIESDYDTVTFDPYCRTFGDFTVQAGTVTYSIPGSSWNLSITGTYTQSGGIHHAQYQNDIGGNFNISGGTFDYFNSIYDISRTITITHGNFNQTGGTFTPPNTFLITDNSNSYTQGNLNISAGTFVANSNSDITAGYSFTQTGGTFNAPRNLNIKHDFTHSSGTFTHDNGLVNLKGYDQNIAGTTTFYDFKKDLSTVGSSATLRFEAGDTFTYTGTLTLKGTLGNILSLRSDSIGTQWNFITSNTPVIDYIDVEDSRNTGTPYINALDPGINSIVNSGNNYGWNFNNPSLPTSLGSSQYTNGSYSNNTRPTLSFNLSDNDNGQTLKYEIIISKHSDYSSPVIDFTSAYAAQGTSTFTVGQSAGSGTYASGEEGQTLTDGSYYWEVRSNDSFNYSSYKNANNGSVAFKITTNAPTGSIKINNDNDYTKSRNVTLNISASSDTVDVASMMISNSSSFSGASYEDYSITKDWTLTSIDGLKTVYIKFKDSVGNISTSYSSTITLDTINPTDPANLKLTIKNGKVNTTWDESSDSGSGIDTYTIKLSSNQDFDSEKTYTSTTNTYILSDTLDNGIWYFKVLANDKAGNSSDYSKIENIEIDTQGPTITNLSVDNANLINNAYTLQNKNPAVTGHITDTSTLKNIIFSLYKKTLTGLSLYSQDTLSLESKVQTTADFKYTFTKELDTSKYTLKIISTDEFLNQSKEYSLDIEVQDSNIASTLEGNGNTKKGLESAKIDSVAQVEKNSIERSVSQSLELEKINKNLKGLWDIIVNFLLGIYNKASYYGNNLLASWNMNSKKTISNTYTNSPVKDVQLPNQITDTITNTDKYLAEQVSKLSSVKIESGPLNSITNKGNQAILGINQKTQTRVNLNYTDKRDVLNNINIILANAPKEGFVSTIKDIYYQAFTATPIQTDNLKVIQSGDNAVTIEWTEKTDTTLSVNYGESLSYGKSVKTTGQKGNYKVELKNLKTNTQYYFEIADTKLNLNLKAYYTFKLIK